MVVQVRKLCELFDELQFHIPDRTGTLLGDDHLANIRCRTAVFIRGKSIVFRAIEEHDHVRILLDGAGFTQVTQHRLFVSATRFHGSAQL